MKKVSTDVEEFAAKVADKEDNPTMHELAKEFPEKTYRELEKYRDADRQQEAARIPLSESQQKQEELEPIGMGHNHPPEEGEEQRLKKEAGACITAGLKRDREAAQFQKTKRAGGYVNEMKEKIKELEIGLANALEINESHQKLNGKLQERLTEVEEENKKIHNHLNKRINNVRKSGF